MATIQLPPDFKEFLKLLISNDVEYLIIGGYAVNYYGFGRATADLDIWIAVDPKNAERVTGAFEACDAVFDHMTDASAIQLIDGTNASPPRRGEQSSRLSILYSAVRHSNEMYG